MSGGIGFFWSDELFVDLKNVSQARMGVHVRWKYWIAAKGCFELNFLSMHPITSAKHTVLHKTFSGQDWCRIITIMHFIW